MRLEHPALPEILHRPVVEGVREDVEDVVAEVGVAIVEARVGPSAAMDPPIQSLRRRRQRQHLKLITNKPQTHPRPLLQYPHLRIRRPMNLNLAHDPNLNVNDPTLLPSSSNRHRRQTTSSIRTAASATRSLPLASRPSPQPRHVQMESPLPFNHPSQPHELISIHS